MDLHISIRGRRGLTAQVYRQIREAVMDGRLQPAEALPSSRALARRLEVSRNTVVVAYERLRAEGFLESRIGAGTFVSPRVRPRASGGVAESPLRPRAVWDRIPEAPDMSTTRVDIDFRPGVPDARRFPFPQWRARVSRHLRPGSVGTGAHIGAAGLPELRAAIARHVAVSRGVRASPENVLVTSGSQQAIDLLARVLLQPGDVVAVEDPGYLLPLRAFQAHGCRIVGVPVDAEGLVVDRIPGGARLVYVTPSHQYPLGVTMSMTRRQALLEWARRADGTLVEDDYDSEFRYGGRPLETLQSLDGSGRVLYVGSFSKVLLPTLRLGFAVVPPPLHAALRKAKSVADWHTAVPVQAAAAELIEDGLLARHVHCMRRVYAERHDRILDILARDLAAHLTPVPSAGGLHLSAFLHRHEGVSDLAVVERARARGVAVFPLSRHFTTTTPRAGLLLGYGAIPKSRIAEGLRRIGNCI